MTPLMIDLFSRMGSRNLGALWGNSMTIAKIPFPLARHIAAYWAPSETIMSIAR